MKRLVPPSPDAPPQRRNRLAGPLAPAAASARKASEARLSCSGLRCDLPRGLSRLPSSRPGLPCLARLGHHHPRRMLGLGRGACLPCIGPALLPPSPPWLSLFVPLGYHGPRRTRRSEGGSLFECLGSRGRLRRDRGLLFLHLSGHHRPRRPRLRRVLAPDLGGRRGRFASLAANTRLPREESAPPRFGGRAAQVGGRWSGKGGKSRQGRPRGKQRRQPRKPETQVMVVAQVGGRWSGDGGKSRQERARGKQHQ